MPWRDAVTWTAHVGIVFLLLISYLVREYEPQTHDKQTSFASILTSIWTPIKNGQNWLGGSAICFLNLPIFVFGAGWGLMYLSEYHHVSRYHASLVVSMIFIGMMIGSPMMGWFSDRFYFSMKKFKLSLNEGQHRGQLLFLSAVGLILLLGMVMLNPNAHWITLAALFFGIGWVSSAQVVGYPYVAEQNAPEFAATAVSIASTLVMAGGFIQPIFGWVLTLNHDVRWIKGIPLYSALDFQLGLGLMMMLFLSTIIMTRFLRK